VPSVKAKILFVACLLILFGSIQLNHKQTCGTGITFVLVAHVGFHFGENFEKFVIESILYYIDSQF
jgi:hypothetical protein